MLRKTLTALAAAILMNAGCARNSSLPETGSAHYRELCTAFYTGLAGLQSGEDVRASEDLTRAAQLAPGEPAVWADLSVFQLRRQEFDAALKSAQTAHDLAPRDSRIEALLGQIQSKRGDVSDCLNHFKKAVSLDSRNLKALYALALETERQGNDAESRQTLEQLLSLDRGNTGVLLEAARLSAKLGDGNALKQHLAALQSQSAAWPEAAQKLLAALQQTTNVQSAAVQVQFLRNVLLRMPAYQRSMDEVRTPTTVVFEPFMKFLRLPSPASEPAPPDTQIHFLSQSIAASHVAWLGAIQLSDQTPATLVWADSAGLHVGENGPVLPLSGTAGSHAIAGADLNYDFKTDLIAATSAGLRIYQQADPQHFTNVTANTKLDPKILSATYTGAWAFDFDLDGDLDIILGLPQGEPLVLRNNGDGTFTPAHPFHGVDGLLFFAAADIDGDGDADVAMIDRQGQLVAFSNERLGEYRRLNVPPIKLLAISAAAVNSSGVPDFIVLRDDFTVARLSLKPEGSGWDMDELAHAKATTGPSNLEFADLDNNGALDLVVGNQVFLNDGKTFSLLAADLLATITSIADLDGDGRLDLVGVTNSGNALKLVNHGTKSYHWQTIRTRAANARGDQRINSFGIAGEMELRAGLLTQKQIIDAPVLHFGLGNQTTVDFARIVWPNGFVQAEFALKADQTVLAQQRLKGSCPFLFSWDGTRMRFVKDTAPWSPALGLHINAQQVAGIYQTQEWFKIPGDALKPRNGFYDLRVTAEYWETFYIDHYSLMVVDHPKGTQIYSDERFAVPPPPLKIYATNDAQPFSHATDDNGNDVTETVRELDSRYLDTFGRGQYQGVTRDHWVELSLPKAAPATGPLYLIAQGWMHPSDATTNIALSQNSAAHPEGLSIEVPDASGKWVTARQGLGFPAGRVKTIVLDLTGIFRPGAERKFRLRTNLEIYWDQLQWASPADSFKTTHLGLSSATLSYRGFSEMKQANISSPELPDYNKLVADGQRWRDMQGYFTRYGDVLELLNKIDDRMVIANAGDELSLKFAAPPAPPEGWLRDYIMVGDGWIKDGDYNSVFSRTVLPLPYHGMKDYTIAPTTLENDPAYRMHPADWQTYHTRYVTPDLFLTGLWSKQ
jgi:Flp pilus assembly protein TadD